MSKGEIKTVKTVSKDGKVELSKVYIGPSTIDLLIPRCEHSNRTWDKWGENSISIYGKLYSVVSDEIEF